MEYFSAAALSNTGTVICEDGEVVGVSLGGATLLTSDKKPTGYSNGLIVVTTHRVVWVDRERKRCIAVRLKDFDRHHPVEAKSSRFSTRVTLRVGSGLKVELGTAKERDLFYTQVAEMVTKREWERLEMVKKREEERKKKESEYVSRRLGVGGVRDKVEKIGKEREGVIKGGFESLDRLRTQAEDLVKIAEMFKRGEGVSELMGMMMEMGMESAVTKESVGGDIMIYREELSRQLAGFLTEKVTDVGGVMTMTDAYCLTIRNRASSELVSPADFKAACGMFRKFGAGLEIIHLESGVEALKVAKGGGIEKLKELVGEGSVTALDIVRIRHIPIQLARRMLEEAEGLGVLCRDETTEGVRFFNNLFDGFVNSASV